MTDEIDPTLLFDLSTDADDLESLPVGTTISVRGPDGEELAEIDTADADAFAFFREGTLVDGAGHSETDRQFYVRDTDR